MAALRYMKIVTMTRHNYYGILIWRYCCIQYTVPTYIYYNMLIRVVFHFMQCTVYQKKKHIQVQSTVVPLTEVTWQRLDYMRYSTLKKI
jgi:hypothetical protein